MHSATNHPTTNKRSLSGWLFRLYLPSVFKGLFNTFLHLFKLRGNKTFTIQYPEVKRLPRPGYRGEHRLKVDELGREKCVACFMCQTVCPANCIRIIAEEAPWPDRDKRPRIFEIDMLRCIYCGMCEEACPCDAIELTEKFNVVSTSRLEKIYDKEKLLSNSAAMDSFVFIIGGILSVVAAGLVVTRRNPVYSTIYLVVFFTLVSLQFLILRSPLLAILQLLVYAGAIMVLFLFVIMLLNLTPDELRENVTRGRKLLAGGFALMIFLLLVATVRNAKTIQEAPNLVGAVSDPVLAQAGEAAAVGEALFTTHALAFEYSSILILVAIIGSIYLTKRRSRAAATKAVAPGGGAVLVGAVQTGGDA